MTSALIPRKMLDSNAESFVGKVLRSASPNILRRQASKSRLQNLSKETPAVTGECWGDGADGGVARMTELEAPAFSPVGECLEGAP